MPADAAGSFRCRAMMGASGNILPVLLVLSLPGCAEDAGSNASAPSHTVASELPVSPAAPAPAAAPADGARADGDVPPLVPRKIIYNAKIDLVVESITGLGERVNALVKKAGGYVSETDQSSDVRARRTASWTVRVPVERFDGFLADVSRLGELQNSHLDSQDVTQEYYDIEARIANKQQEEKRLLKHLADSTGKLEDILAVEKELTRVRGEIEQMQGRIRFLANVTSLSTVTISASEVRDYTPPVKATFATRIARTFRESLDLLADFGTALVLVGVALAPWLPLILVVALLIRWVVRRSRRRAERQAPVVLTRPTS